MDISKTKAVLALGISGAMSVGAANARVPDTAYEKAADHSRAASDSIISVSGPNIRVTVYDGIATMIGKADSSHEADAAEQEIRAVPGIEHVINLITWG